MTVWAENLIRGCNIDQLLYGVNISKIEKDMPEN
jgi:hypothetical protein